MEYALYAGILLIFSIMHYYISALFLKIIAYLGKKFSGFRKDLAFIGVWFGYVCFIVPPLLLIIHIRNLMNPNTIANWAELAWIVFWYIVFVSVGIIKLIKNKKILMNAGYIKSNN